MRGPYNISLLPWAELAGAQTCGSGEWQPQLEGWGCCSASPRLGPAGSQQLSTICCPSCPQDVLVVTAPGSGAEIIPFLKTYLNLPLAIGFTVLYTKVGGLPGWLAGWLAKCLGGSGAGTAREQAGVLQAGPLPSNTNQLCLHSPCCSWPTC